MDHKARILKRTDNLLKQGAQVCSTEHSSEGRKFVDNDKLLGWNLRCRTLVTQVEPKGGPYQQELSDFASRFDTNADEARRWMAALVAFRAARAASSARFASTAGIALVVDDPA